MSGVTGPAVRADVQVSVVGPEAAAEVVRIIHAAFGARPALDPPATALEETAESVAVTLSGLGGLLARDGDRAVGAALMDADGSALWLRRVSVVPEAQRLGVARALAHAAEEVAVRRGFRTLEVTARSELPATVRLWDRLGFRETERDGTVLTLTKPLPVAVPVATAEDMRALGARLASLVRAGDVLLLSGELGAGKTTLTQGLGRGLGVRGEVTSPTFVISRVHPSTVGGPALVHVDAYRLAGVEELEDLGLEVALEESVTVVEWGEGIAEDLAGERLEIVIHRAVGDSEAGEQRTVLLRGVGDRWPGAALAGAVA